MVAAILWWRASRLVAASSPFTRGHYVRAKPARRNGAARRLRQPATAPGRGGSPDAYIGQEPAALVIGWGGLSAAPPGQRGIAARAIGRVGIRRADRILRCSIRRGAGLDADRLAPPGGGPGGRV